MTFKEIKTRWKATTPGWAKVGIKIVLIAQAIIAVTVESAEYFNFIPPQYIPDPVKAIIGFIAMAGATYFKLQTEPTETKKP